MGVHEAYFVRKNFKVSTVVKTRLLNRSSRALFICKITFICVTGDAMYSVLDLHIRLLNIFLNLNLVISIMCNRKLLTSVILVKKASNRPMRVPIGTSAIPLHLSNSLSGWKWNLVEFLSLSQWRYQSSLSYRQCSAI